MSLKVYPMMVADPKKSEVRTVHLVPPGHDRCVVCGASKFRMGFHYTDEVHWWRRMVEFHGDDLSDFGAVGLWNPSEHMAMPYKPCLPPSTAQPGDSDTVREGLNILDEAARGQLH